MTNQGRSIDRLALLLQAGDCVCAMPLADVREVMRPLPLEPIAGMPEFVMGLSVIRGAPTPVVQLSRLIHSAGSAAIRRFVTIRVAERTAALAVDGVAGIHDMHNIPLHEMPPLLRDARKDLIEAVGALDSQLLIVLRALRILPDDLWRALTGEAAA